MSFDDESSFDDEKNSPFKFNNNSLLQSQKRLSTRTEVSSSIVVITTGRKGRKGPESVCA